MAASIAALLPACGSACCPMVLVHIELACKAMLHKTNQSQAGSCGQQQRLVVLRLLQLTCRATLNRTGLVRAFSCNPYRSTGQ